ncbi:MAG TPA: hypothetical protein DER23_03045 [Clostridiales bacterium]|nr:hypothetical protein [Clostridiales bacterium]
MSVKYIKVRFNTDKEDDHKAYDTIQNANISQSKFIIAAVNAYGGYLSTEEDKKQLCLAVQEAVHASIREIFGGGINPTAPQQFSSQLEENPKADAEESGKIADDFLENFI